MYTRARIGRHGRASERGWSRARGGFGDVGIGLQGFQFPSGQTPALYLTRQVNRFVGVRTPVSFPVPLTADVAPIVAFWAAMLYNESVQDALKAGTASDVDATLASAALLNPSGYVKTNIAQIAAGVTGYADALKMPPASGLGPTNIMMAAVVVGAGVLAFALLPKGILR